MEKKHWWAIVVCVMISFISIVLYANYYNDYVKPKSYTIGSYKPKDYTSLEIKEQLKSEDVLFNQDIDNTSFKIDDSTGIATYEYSASAVNFNGENNDYIIYVNNYMLSNLDTTSGAISGVHNIRYYDVDKSILATTQLNLSFSSYTKQLLFKLTLPKDDVGLLMRYFEVNDFIVTLALNPFRSNTSVELSQYNVEFIVNDEIVSTQTVKFGQYATAPVLEAGYSWYIEDTRVDVTTTAITTNTTFVAKYVESMNGSFSNGTHTIVVENEELISWTNNGNVVNFTKFSDGTYWKNYDGTSFNLYYDFDNECWTITIYSYDTESTSTLTRQSTEVQDTYSITFNASMGTFVDTEGWTLSNGVATKQVIAGEEIGILPNYTVSGSTIDYWYYVENDEQIKITSTSLMPNHDITIVPKMISNSQGI